MAIVYSHPTWMVKRWMQRFGAAETEDLLNANNRWQCTHLSPRKTFVLYQHSSGRPLSSYTDLLIQIRINKDWALRGSEWKASTCLQNKDCKKQEQRNCLCMKMDTQVCQGDWRPCCRIPAYGLRANSLKRMTTLDLITQVRSMGGSVLQSDLLPTEFCRVEAGLQQVVGSGMCDRGLCMVGMPNTCQVHPPGLFCAKTS